MAAYLRSAVRLLPRQTRAFLPAGNDAVTEACRRHVRGLRRKPVRVVVPEAGPVKTGAPPRPTEPRVKRDRESPEGSGPVRGGRGEQTPGRQVITAGDRADGLRFERAQPGDKRLSRLVSVARSRTYREHQGKIFLEGRRLICDALNAGANPQMVFFSTVDRLKELPLDKLKRATLVKVKFEDIKIWSDLVAPQGVIAIFSRPDPLHLNFANPDHLVPLSLICDNVRDPGNLGTMLRCAAAAGCHNVLLTKGCVDAWEPKVLRAAMGAHFRLPIHSNLNWDKIKDHLPKNATVHVADNTCGPDRSRESEDLQVNGSNKPSKAGDYGWVSTRLSHSDVHYEEYDSEDEDEGPSFPRVDAKLYHESWAQGHTALVIGGETRGLSLESLQLSEETAGHRLFIPIVPDVDSLNSAMAASVLLFEGRRQLLKLMQTSGKKWQSKTEGRF